MHFGAQPLVNFLPALLPLANSLSSRSNLTPDSWGVTLDDKGRSQLLEQVATKLCSHRTNQQPSICTELACLHLSLLPRA